VIKKCLFPVAGYGTRFLPATKSMPKEMLPIVNKPLVQYGVEEAIEAGMLNCALVTGRGKRAIADHFDISYELEHQIAGSAKEQYLTGIRDVIERGVFTMVRQRAMLGLGHAILTGEPLIGDQPFGVVLSDDLCLNAGGTLRGVSVLHRRGTGSAHDRYPPVRRRGRDAGARRLDPRYGDGREAAAGGGALESCGHRSIHSHPGYL
jgi:UTP--glucose-1-phosphate uridylyltransferase